jgi:hypothetical protein
LSSLMWSNWRVLLRSVLLGETLLRSCDGR